MKKHQKNTLYLLIGLIFAILNIYLNFGVTVLLSQENINTGIDFENNIDKLLLFISDVLIWPLILFLNMLFFYPFLLSVLTLTFFVYSIMDNFNFFDKCLIFLFTDDE